jgi:hypothetical protein
MVPEIILLLIQIIKTYRYEDADDKKIREHKMTKYAENDV